MEITDKLVKPIVETKYLTAENVWRYRVIIRHFYFENKKMNYWLYQDDIFEELKTHDLFADYTPEQCRQDLDALVAWKNLLPLQDTRKVATIEDFKNKKFRYQLSKYTVEIEEMALKLENVFSEGASLEPTLLERLTKELSKFPKMVAEKEVEVYGWWAAMINDFTRLNQNYQDYIRDLNSIRAEEMMRTHEFLIFKDRLIEYLRNFVKALQRNTGLIEKYISSLSEEEKNIVFEKVIAYELSIPRLDIEFTEQDVRETIVGRWQSIENWFVGSSTQTNEAARLMERTSEIIRKITRYASQISELHNSGANRKEEYRKICTIFHQCQDIKEAHRLAAVLFGVEMPMHIHGNFLRKTESINSGVYEEEPFQITLTPRSRVPGAKINRSYIRQYSTEKEVMKQQIKEKIAKEQALLDSYIVDDKIDFATLSVIEPEVRSVLLRWLAKALENQQNRGVTEDGKSYCIERDTGEGTCVIRCRDGQFTMPHFRIIFDRQNTEGTDERSAVQR